MEEAPLYSRIYRDLKRKILSGTLEAGRRLPSSRELAADLGVSRSVVVRVYEQLVAEGYVLSRVGSGTVVAPGAAFSSAGGAASGIGRDQGRGKTSKRKGASDSISMGAFRTDLIDFRTGLPDLAGFPIALWQRLCRRVLERITALELAYGRPEGVPELREEVAAYLRRQREILCDPEDIVVTAGTTQAIGLVTRMLSRGDKRPAVLEDPITSDIRRIVRDFGAPVLSVPADDEGLMTHLLPAGISPLFIYVTPSHHFPLGGILPVRRRLELARYAEEKGAYIVEDDYDSEFRFAGPPVGTLKELAPDRVVYIGSFSKTVFPALRLAFLLLPPSLVDKAREGKWFTDLHNPVVEQKVLAAFIREGHFERHILRAKRRLAANRGVLEKALRSRFGDSLRFHGEAAGLHLAVSFPGRRFDLPLLRKIEERGVKVYPASFHSAGGAAWRDTLLFGYGMLDPDRLRRGVEILAEVLLKG